MISNTIIPENAPILITGSNGFVGSKVVSCLLEHGFSNLRCFVRPSGNIDRINTLMSSYPNANIEIIRGNLLVRENCIKAVKDVAVIYHLAAGRGKSFSGCFFDSVVSTRNLLDAIIGNTGFKRIVNVSSFAVYSNFKIPKGGLLDENCPIERDYMKRFDSYAFGKIKQDDIVIEYSQKHGIKYTILRPGIVFGPGRPGSITGRAGTETFGFLMKIRGKNRQPLTFIDNCADAIVRAGVIEGIDGEVFNVVDDDLPTGNELIDILKKKVHPFFSLPIPYHIYYFFCFLWEKYAKWSNGQLPPVLNRMACSAYYKGNTFSNEKLKRLVDWKPKIKMEDGLEKYCVYLKKAKGHIS